MNRTAPFVLIFVLLFLPAMTSFSTTTTISIPNSVNPVNPESIPLGDGNVSLATKVGSVYACQTSFNGGGAQGIGPWINENEKTWNSTSKIAVEGNVSWPSAYFNVQISGNQRIVSGNDLPIDHGTGTFPISSTDPAYQYDRNPNHIVAHPYNLTLPANPVQSNIRTCVPMGPIGVLTDGVFLYNALDALGRDAAAHEILDSCGGHPDSSDLYHHHEVPSCILDKATGSNTSTLVGYAIDGYGIYVERDGSGNLLTNSNLDACHGRTSEVMWDGKLTMMYHYDATLEYPYAVGCLVGTSVRTQFTGPIAYSSTISTSSTTSTTTTTTTVSASLASATSTTTIPSTSTTGSSTSALSAANSTSTFAASTSETSTATAAISVDQVTSSGSFGPATGTITAVLATIVVMIVVVVSYALFRRRGRGT